MIRTSDEKVRFARGAAFMGAACALVLSAQMATAAPPTREEARRMYDRIAGVPPSEAKLNEMVGITDPIEAAMVATGDPAFYSVTLKNMVTPWTNRDQTVFAPLNDYTATVIGAVRDDVDFSTILSEDILYTVNAGVPAVSAVNNDHYAAAEDQSINLMTALTRTQQSAAYGTPANATAGLMTTRAASAAFFIDGTNRAMFRFTMVNHMCRDMEQLADTTRPPDRIRQDVSRSPGGDSRLFLNNCIGCHSGMDPMTQAFAYYDFDETQGRLVYTPGTVNGKYFINADNFKPGFITPNDNWENRWRHGHNKLALGFDTGRTGSGAGAKSLGDEIGHSDRFAMCQVEKVFKAVCFRAPSNQSDRDEVQVITANFRGGGYKLKRVFAETAAYCKGP